ncbi:MAG: PKD domain-containing protein [Phaeodactylibacter sp.]|nr:PKD domain-containing protein [Phaeodactylibacter sp.]
MLPSKLSATHIVGGDISYRCLGNNEYEIILNVYRDCLNASPAAVFDDPAHIGIFTNFSSDPLDVIDVPFDPMIDDTISNTLVDPCFIISEDICVHTTTYRTTVTLPYIAGGYTVAYSRCCRNNIIDNIVNPVGVGTTFYIRITEEVLSGCGNNPANYNTAPDFGSVAPIYVCSQTPLIYDHSASEPDGDSLVYRLCTPVKGATSTNPDPDEPDAPPYDPVDWIEPFFGVDNMLGGTIQPLAIDSESGLLTAFPEFIGTYVVGVCVDEYRDGIRISSLRRDFQYTVQDCGVVTSSFFSPEAQCDDLEVHFNNESIFADMFKWYFDWPNPNFTSTQTSPTFTYPDTGTYTIALIAEPGSICADTFFREIFLQDNSLFPNFDFEVFNCSDQAVVTVQDLSVDTITMPVAWNWEITYDGQSQTSDIQNPTFIIPNDVTVMLSLEATSQNGCIQSFASSFTTNSDFPAIYFEDEFNICLGESVNLNPNFQEIGNVPYYWSPEASLDDPMALNPLATPQTNTLYTAQVYAPDSICTYEHEVAVFVTPLPELNFSSYINCDDLTVDFTNLSEDVNTYVWDFGDNTSSSNENPTHTYGTFGSYEVSLMSGPTDLCKDTLTQTLDVIDNQLVADFTYSISDCETNGVTIQFNNTSINSLNNTASYFWQISGFGTFDIPNPSVFVTGNGNLQAILTITTDEGCQDVASATIPIELIVVSIQDEVLTCTGEPIALNPGGNPAYSYEWSPAGTLSDPNAPNPIATPTQTTVYTAVITQFGFDACTVTREITVVVPPELTLPADDIVQTCDPTMTLTASPNLPVDAIQWESPQGNVISNETSITVNVSGSQDYFLAVGDEFGCIAEQIIRVQGGPVQIEATDQEIVCSNQPIQVSVINLDPNDILDYQWSPVGAIVSGANSATPIISNVPGETNLTVTATSQYGCTAEASSFVVVFDENIDLAFDYEVLCDGTTVVFNNQSSNAFNYLWDFGDNTTSTEENPTHVYSTIGDYTVTLTVIYNGLVCVQDDVQLLETITPDVVSNFTYSYDNCAEDEIVVSFTDASINNFGNDVTYSWTFSNGMTSDEANPTIALDDEQMLTATLTIETDNGCEATSSQTLEIDFTEVTLVDEMILCPGDTAELNPGADPSYTYQWIPATGLSDATAPNPLVFVDQTTTYTVRIQNVSANTCLIERMITVEVPPVITIDLGTDPDTISCSEPITISAAISPAVDFIWTDGQGFSSMDNPIVVMPADTTTYYIEATDAFGCSERDSVRILADLPLSIDLTPDVLSCNEPVNLTAVVSGGVPDVITWTDGTSFVTGVYDLTINPDPNTITTYTVTVEDELGCEVSASVEVQFPIPVNVAIPDTVISCNEMIMISSIANVPIVNYDWTNSDGMTIGDQATIGVTPAESTNYYLEVEDQFGCMAYDSVFVTVPPEIFINTSDNVVNCNVAVDLSAISNLDPNVSYEWYDGNDLISTNPTITVNPPVTTTYTVIAADEYGCEATNSIEVTVPVPISIGVNVNDTTYCAGPVLLEATSNYTPANYIWTTSDGTFVGAEAIIVVDPDFMETYYVSVTNADNCATGDSVLVTNGEIDVEINSPLIFCPADSVNILVTNLDDNDILQYQWLAGPGGMILSDPSQDSITIQAEPGSDVTFYINIENQFECVQEDSVVVMVSNFDPVNLDTLRLCPGVPTELYPLGNPDYAYNWTPGTGLNDSTIANPTAILYDDVTYTVEITDLNGLDTCSAIYTLAVEVNPLINLEAYGDTTLCVQVDVDLLATTDAPVDFTWSEDPDFSNVFSTDPDPTVTPVGNSVYYVAAEDDLGCRDSAVVTINSFPIDIELDPLYQLCLFDEVQLEVINNALDQILIYTWDPINAIVSGGATGTPIVDPQISTNYTVEVVNQYGCIDTAKTFVQVIDVETALFAQADPDTIILDSGQFSQLTTNDSLNYSYIWEPAGSLSDNTIFNPIASPEETTTYTVTVEGIAGCTSTRTVTVVVINPDCEEPFIFVPTGFTPNDDGINDVLYVRGNNIDELYFTVYNRWGQKLFETEDVNVGWDGTYKGERLPPDVYGYYIRAKCYNSEEFFKKGNITLIR